MTRLPTAKVKLFSSHRKTLSLENPTIDTISSCLSHILSAKRGSFGDISRRSPSRNRFDVGTVMQGRGSPIPLFLTASLAVNAETTSCVTSTKTFPTITSIIVEPTSTWSGNGAGGGPHTVYITKHHEFCSTGLRLHTYTITEACHQEKCQPRTTGVPPSFTSTVTVCNSYGERPITATLTVPCPEATATKGPGKPQPEHCKTCHNQGKPSSKPPVKPQPVPSAPAEKPVPTGPRPEECSSVRYWQSGTCFLGLDI
ncbi:hypothetical protein FAGAP_9255 [Fusarium agapanthi]|uniref:Uncharacterized protein n=1 Tax=Fusarium agapanthi TaxID=1803897 RepID=A0A9P5B402_9HYPO|nr:hypothetical protein FAGAP_9255 [Fusarium agapanthi]